MITPYHTKYFAWELTKRCSSHQLEKLNQSIFNASVDLNPHQIDAALFAFQSPLSRGALLADEVGLGKTIEAALIISQLWAERKRRILCIAPAALRPQWSRELLEKFFIGSIVLDSKSYKRFVEENTQNPFEQPDQVVICSYHFARTKASDLKAVPWDLVVIDEAHRLRNVYKKDNKIARAIKEAIGGSPKVLLTATPLQNTLLELYGLVSFIDPHIFGSLESFRGRFSARASDMSRAEFETLKSRIEPICKRTLRRQVQEYIRYTERIPITQDFTPTAEEARLYEAVSGYLQRPDSFALPSGQRSLMTLILRKILASSSFAIADTLGALIARLEIKARDMTPENEGLDVDAMVTDYDPAQELSDEWSGDDSEDEASEAPAERNPARQKCNDALKGIREELQELKDYKRLAETITRNAKGEALLAALKHGLAKAIELGAPQKALIFTESRRTQRYLMDLLERQGFGGQVVTLSGTNADAPARNIHRAWLERHRGQDCVTGSYDVDVRSALVEEFERSATIMIATESGAEGLNLQFCSLVVNYDLPWNPQRVEQRIGRCHRYGQKHDVVVINFLNRGNAADQRVFELLAEKFQLFSGIFGASDEILGAIGSGVDFEKRINGIYQSCRTTEEINTAFDRLQADLDEQICTQFADARSKLMEHFDEDVHRTLRLSRAKTDEQVDRFGMWLWQLAKGELSDYASFAADNVSFEIKKLPPGLPSADIPLGKYRLITSREGETEHHYRIGHPLAECLLQRARERVIPPLEVTFHYESHPGKISVLEELQGKKGWLRLVLLSIDAMECEDHLIFCGCTDDGHMIDHDICRKFFDVDAMVGEEASPSDSIEPILQGHFEKRKGTIVEETATRNREYFESEMEKLELWAEDLKEGLEREIKEIDRDIRALKKEARQAPDLEGKVALHRQVKDHERKRNAKRRTLFEAQDEVDIRKETLIGEIEGRLEQRVEEKELFTIRWKIA